MIQKFEKKLTDGTQRAIAERVEDKIWIHMNGETMCVDIESRGGRRRGKVAAKDVKSNLIHAPMPGKITKLFKNVGDAVVVGESVLVMEAMKMEYTLKANMAGSIKTVTFKEGDQVVLGAQIVEIEPHKEL